MIDVACGCGKRMRVADEHAGKVIRCPQCRNPLPVPAAPVAPVPVPPAERTYAAPAPEPEPERRPAAPSPTPADPEPTPVGAFAVVERVFLRLALYWVVFAGFGFSVSHQSQAYGLEQLAWAICSVVALAGLAASSRGNRA